MTYVDCVNVSPKLITLKVGTWFYGASAQTCPCESNCSCVTWSSNNTSVAIVNETSGYVYAKSAGTAIICAMANDGGGKCDYMTVVVKEKVLVESINLNWSNITVEKNKEITLEANVLPMEADSRDVVWSSDNISVAEVSCDGVVMTKSGGMATITATSVDGSNVKGLCNIVVTDNKLVNEIKITPCTLKMALSQTEYLSEEVYPGDATIKSVSWSSSNNSIASVHPDTGLVIPHDIGTVTITATANDNSGVYSECSVEIYAIPINSIEMFIKTKTMEPGEETVFTTKICPVNANYKSLRWYSSNPKVAEVNRMTGKVTALKDGTATITAKDVSSDVTATATVKVDSREKVIVQKDNHSFYVKFVDGKVWKSIGIDLSNRQENYNQLYPPEMWYENYDYLIEEEQRFLDNFENFYSEKQFALLYLLDPFGVEYYLNQYNAINYAEQIAEKFENYDDKLRAYLEFKDRIYKEIFGTLPTPFVLSNDGRRVNVTWSYDRIDVFTDSELIFGAHNIVDMVDLLERAVDLIIHLVDSILPDTTKNKWIMRGVNVAKTLLFSGSIVEAFSDVASDFLDNYIEESSNGEITIMEWPNPLLDNIYNFKKGINEILTLPNIHDIEICDKVNKQNNYKVEFSNGTFEMFLEEVIELCS